MKSPATYHLCYCGLLADRRGLAEERLSHPATTAAELYDSLAAAHHLGLARTDLWVAVNDVIVPWNHPLNDGDLIVLLPPMSGG